MSLLEGLRGGLIVSVQAWKGSALDDPAVIAAMARAAQESGAVAVRIQGVEHLRAVRRRVEVPVIGLIKREYPGFEPYITPTLLEIGEVLEAGADVVALDATARAHPREGLESLIEAVRGAGRVAMADCATLEEALAARRLGAGILGTTLCGYTPETAATPLPALELVRAIRQNAPAGTFVVCEGGVQRPKQVRAALEAGADAVVVGTAITNVDWLVREFAGAADIGPLKGEV